MEKMKVFGLMAVMSILMVMLGGYVGGNSGAMMFFVMSLAMNFGMYWFSDKIVLKQYRAHVVRPGEEGGRFDELYAMVDRLRHKAGLPMPVVAVSEQQQPNAFATGRNPEHAVVCVTRGMWEMVQNGHMPVEELEGVMAHELAHIKHYHMLVGTVAASMAGAIMLVSRMAMFFGGGRDDNRNPLGMILMMILAPIAAMLIRAAISQRNEFEADATGAAISGKPMALANALQRIEHMAKGVPMQVSPAASHLAIIHPFSAGGILSLFQTHPPTEQRVAKLRDIAAGAGVASLQG